METLARVNIWLSGVILIQIILYAVIINAYRKSNRTLNLLLDDTLDMQEDLIEISGKVVIETGEVIKLNSVLVGKLQAIYDSSKCTDKTKCPNKKTKTKK